MKKIRILSAIIIISLLMGLMLVPVSANDEKVIVSKDYSYIEYNGKKFIRVDPADIYFMNSLEYWYDVEFEGGDSMIQSFECSINSSAIELWVSYNDGGYTYYYYISELLLPQYESYIINGGGDILAITINNNTISEGKDHFFDTELTVPGYELNYYSMLGDVFSPVFDDDVNILSGFLLGDSEGNFYYVDYIKSSEDTDTPFDMQEKVKIWQITEGELIKLLKEALDDYNYDDFYGDDDIYYDDDDDFGIGVGIALLVILLGLVPLAGSIVSFCVSFGRDKKYKLRLRIISALCLLAVIITVVTVIICSVIAI